MNCDFYLLKALSPTVHRGYKYTVGAGGSLEFVAASGYTCTGLISADDFNKRARLIQLPPLLILQSAEVIQADENEKLIAKTLLGKAEFVKLENDTKYFALSFQGAEYNLLEECSCFFGYLCTPHYKKLSLKYTREANQIFFRKTLDGKMTLHREDFQFVAQSRLEDKLLFNMYRSGSLISANGFNKTDCKLDWAKEAVELKFFSEDNYTKILDAYENTFDLIRCAPALSKLQLTKRAVYQIYQAGGDTITSYFAGTYYENEVSEAIDDEAALTSTYHFAKLRDFVEIVFSGFNYKALNTSYAITKNTVSWSGYPHSYTDINGVEKIGAGRIFLLKEVSRGDYAGDANPNEESPESQTEWRPRLSDNVDVEVTRYVLPSETESFGYYEYTTDLYRIYIQADGQILYSSSGLYVLDNGLPFSGNLGGRNCFLMNSAASSLAPQPSSFYLSNYIYRRGIFARVLSAAEAATDSMGQPLDLYDLPANDFAVTHGNYKKCIGLTNIDIWQSTETVQEPTKYGINDFGEYFTSNFIPTQASMERPLPVARSNWGNVSLWYTEGVGYKNMEESLRKVFILKDAYSIADVIKALLKKIDSSLSFEASTEYSSFLYPSSGSYGLPIGHSVYITPKSNVLKGDYDQAARKAELTFKELMDMLRNCFRCYWFVDGQNRFRIEHISYFTGHTSQLDLTCELDKFTKKKVLFAQSEIAFDKKDLPARYEFNWMDDSTDLFGNFALDIDSQYVQKDKREEVIASKFSSDIDFMMLFPEKFSEDGFALIIAETSTGKVPIVLRDNLKDDEFRHAYDAEIQNYYASWLHLVNYYMKDMPARSISYTSLTENSLEVEQLKRSMTNEVTCPDGFNLDVNTPITTSFGQGTIEELEINVDTEQASITLSYVPT